MSFTPRDAAAKLTAAGSEPESWDIEEGLVDDYQIWVNGEHPASGFPDAATAELAAAAPSLAATIADAVAAKVVYVHRNPDGTADVTLRIGQSVVDNLDIQRPVHLLRVQEKG